MINLTLVFEEGKIMDDVYVKMEPIKKYEAIL